MFTKAGQPAFVFLFLIPILVINAYQAPAESQYLAEGNEDGVVDLTQRWAAKSRHQHRAPESAQCSGEYKL